jgi:hypothetical protein
MVLGAALFLLGWFRVSKRTTWGHLVAGALTPWQQAAQKQEFRLALRNPVYRGDWLLYHGGLALLSLGLFGIAFLWILDFSIRSVF